MASFARKWIDNPIARAELSHQERSVPRLKWRRFPVIFGLGLGVALISNGGLLFAPQIAPLIRIGPDDLTELLNGWFGTLMVLLGALIMIHHLAFATSALQLGSTTVAREKEGRTWESLLLTGVDARRIVFGKWLATVQTLWQVYRPLLILRFAVALWMGLAGGLARISPFSAAPPLISVILIAAVTSIFPMCYAGFTVMIGLLASLLAKNETTAHRIGSLFLYLTFFLSICMILVTFLFSFTNIELGLASVIPAIFVTPLDGGMLSLIGIVADNATASLSYLFGLLLCMALYAGLTWLGLRGAQTLAVRQHATPPI